MDELKLKLNVHITMKFDPFGRWERFITTYFFLKGEIPKNKGILRKKGYAKIRINLFDSNYKYFKIKGLKSHKKFEIKAISTYENYLNKIFEIAENDCKELNAEIENNDIKARMKFIIDALKGGVKWKS
jgi:hypothetical protein